MNNSIRPGQIWLDTDGKAIEAHGGSLFYEDGTFYWYGENKDHTDGVSKVWTWGIKYYSSTDLYNWKYEGYLIEPEEEDESSMRHPHRRMDRPHIVYNRVSGKYVCWIKYSGEDACFGIFTADRFAGPYTAVREHFRPYGKKAGDFDLCVDEETGKGYLYFDSDHSGLLCAELTEDYLDVTEKTSLHFAGLHAPFCREAPAHFIRNGLHYLLTSGMTGYVPNPSESAVGGDWHGPYEGQGDPHVNDDSRASFNSQISQVFRHPQKKDLYIALADRWVPDYVVTKERYEAIERAIASHFDKSYQPTQEDYALLMSSPMLASADTSKSRYVWLPLRFEGDRVRIDWKDEWRAEDYE
ncbi:MAG: family 43 glycosylhydrolase [Eubacteriales bacterium]|nr:family 43 glycosylhydrolase [Eubacteriales bacterium]